MYRVTAVCCLIKMINLSVVLYEICTNSQFIDAGVLTLGSTLYLILNITYAATCLFGELGLFLSLVILLEIHAKKAKNSFIENAESTKANSFLKDSLIA